MPGKISIKDIRLYAYHGCLEEESRIGGNYIVDIDIETDFSEAAMNDKLSLTVDYCIVYDIVRREMGIRSKLIEHVAYRIAHALKKEITRIEKVSVTISKIAPPVNGEMGKACVTYVL